MSIATNTYYKKVTTETWISHFKVGQY